MGHGGSGCPLSSAHSAGEKGQPNLPGIFLEMQRTKRAQIIFYRCCCLWQKSRSKFQLFTPPLISSFQPGGRESPPHTRPQPWGAPGCPSTSFPPPAPQEQKSHHQHPAGGSFQAPGKGGEKRRCRAGSLSLQMELCSIFKWQFNEPFPILSNFITSLKRRNE